MPVNSWKDWLHPIATVLGAWGGFPKPPRVFLELTKYELFRWFLVFVLAYQGGADEEECRFLYLASAPSSSSFLIGFSK